MNQTPPPPPETLSPLEREDAAKFLELIGSECSAAHAAQEHEWRKCRRCLALAELEGPAKLANRYLRIAIAALRAAPPQATDMEAAQELDQVRQILAADMTRQPTDEPLPAIQTQARVGSIALACFGMVQELRQHRAGYVRSLNPPLPASPPAPPADLVAAERIRELRAELESAVDRESARVVERQHAMTTAQHYAHLVALVREWQASFNKEWERAPSGDFEHPANVRHAKAENDLFAWTPPAAPPVEPVLGTLERIMWLAARGEVAQARAEFNAAVHAAPPVPEGECPECEGRGYQDQGEGCVSTRCDACNGTGRSPEAAPPERPAQDKD